MEQNINPKKGIKAISILFYILAGIFVVLGIADLFLIFINWTMLFFSIFLIGLAILFFFTAKGLREGKNWAKISAIVVSGLGIIWSITLLFQGSYIAGTFYLILSGLVGVYLLFLRS